MLSKTRFDELIERLSRTVAGRTGRRSFIGRVGTAVAGGVLLPLLPVDRRGRLSRAHAASGTREGWKPQDQDTAACDYWRHCSLDGYVCDCCGGTVTNCPAGTVISPSSWVASCHNPGDNTAYLIAYRDCCGKNVCGRCACLNTEGELPVYRPEFGNDIIWCYGAEGDATTYHCTVSPIIGKA